MYKSAKVQREILQIESYSRQIFVSIRLMRRWFELCDFVRLLYRFMYIFYLKCPLFMLKINSVFFRSNKLKEALIFDGEN